MDRVWGGKEGDKERGKLFSHPLLPLLPGPKEGVSTTECGGCPTPDSASIVTETSLVSLCPLFSRRHQSLDEGPILVITSCQPDVIFSNSISPKRPDSWV